MVVPDILGDIVVHGTHGQDVVIRFHEGKETVAFPDRKLKATFKSDAFQKSPYIFGIVVKAHTFGCQNIEQTNIKSALKPLL
jgi:hypothetical protein